MLFIGKIKYIRLQAPSVFKPKENIIVKWLKVGFVADAKKKIDFWKIRRKKKRLHICLQPRNGYLILVNLEMMVQTIYACQFYLAMEKLTLNAMFSMYSVIIYQPRNLSLFDRIFRWFVWDSFYRHRLILVEPYKIMNFFGIILIHILFG